MDSLMILFGLGLALMSAGPGLLILAWAMRRGTTWALLAATATAAGVVWWIQLYRVASGKDELPIDCYSSDCPASAVRAGAILGYLPTAMGGVLAILLLVAVMRHLRRSHPADLGQARAGR
jgi:hypothetical protein